MQALASRCVGVITSRVISFRDPQHREPDLIVSFPTDEPNSVLDAQSRRRRNWLRLSLRSAICDGLGDQVRDSEFGDLEVIAVRGSLGSVLGNFGEEVL